ncbi:ebs1p [Saccharomyces arboricola H-6]|uniref:Nonsense-mediated mRNA decay factor n=1 Tax=Saccharomyces arboricola (strain H-6 / AS 2.3317 / CBS 10644) TaxID=1160507 RepID=J8LJX4_SACAR|nr:ebs1p [Saccharomyces arboricola H-6]
MELPNTQTEDIPAAFNGIKNQLNSILKSNQLFQDYALLNGFLAFVHSKSNALVISSVESQYALQISKISPKTEPVSFDHGKISLILDFSWESVHYPIFKWFQMWRNYILFQKENKKQQTRFIEFRKMTSKMLKFFKTVQSFYLDIINTVYKRYNIYEFLPNKIIEDLKLNAIEGVGSDGDNRAVGTISNDSPFVVLISTIFHRCMLFLGTAQRYKSLLGESSNKYTVSNFEKSLDFFHLASLMLPSAGETYSQTGAVFLQTGNLGTAMYNFIKGMMTKMPSPVSIKNFQAIMVDNKSFLNRNLHTVIMNTYLQESKGGRTPTREILEFYYLGLFGSMWSPNSWRDDSKPNQLNNGIKVKHLEVVLYETMSTRYLNNLQTIFNNLIITIGGFHLMLKRRSDIHIKTLEALRSNELDYLKFAFKFIVHIINDIVKKSWSENPEVPEILGMVRVINCWIKSNLMVLQYSQTNIEFVNSMAYLINDIMKKKPSFIHNINEHLPNRTYWFEEDLTVKGLTFINFQLSDFEDQDEIFEMDHNFDRLIGDPPLCDKKSASSELLLRLRAIVSLSSILLMDNKCGVEWSDDKSRYIFNKNIGLQETFKTSMNSSKQFGEKTKLQRKTKRLATNGSISMVNLERQMRNSSLHSSSSPTMGYSGSSVPMAPDTFNVKPSGILTGNKTNSKMFEIEVSDQIVDEIATNFTPGFSSAAASSSTSTSESPFDLNKIRSPTQTNNLDESFAKPLQALNEQTPTNDIYHAAQNSTQGNVYSPQQPPLMAPLNPKYLDSMMSPPASVVSYPYNFLNQQSQELVPPFHVQDSQWQNDSLSSRNFMNPTWVGGQHQSIVPPVYAPPQQQMFQQPMQQEARKYMQLAYGAQSPAGNMKGTGRNDMF